MTITEISELKNKLKYYGLEKAPIEIKQSFALSPGAGMILKLAK